MLDCKFWSANLGRQILVWNFWSANFGLKLLANNKYPISKSKYGKSNIKNRNFTQKSFFYKILLVLLTRKKLQNWTKIPKLLCNFPTAYFPLSPVFSLKTLGGVGGAILSRFYNIWISGLTNIYFKYIFLLASEATFGMMTEEQNYKA